MSEKAALHESFGSAEEIKVGSERSFGIVFAVVFSIVAAWPLKEGGDIRIWAAIVAAIFLVAGFFFPVVLRPLNLLWFKFGMLLQRIVSPIIMAFLFFVTIMPIGLLLRLFGKDLLRLRLDPGAESYWIARETPNAEDMRNQF